MNDVQQFVFKSHQQSIEQYQVNSECWNLVVDEGLLQVDIFYMLFCFKLSSSVVVELLLYLFWENLVMEFSWYSLRSFIGNWEIREWY